MPTIDALEPLYTYLSLLLRSVVAARAWWGWRPFPSWRLAVFPMLLTALVIEAAGVALAAPPTLPRVGGALWARLLIDAAVLAALFLPRDLERSRRSTEEALGQSEARLRMVITHAPIVLFALDRGGLFTFSDGRSLATLGLEPGQVVGDSVFDLYHDQPEILGNIERGLAGEERSWTASVAERCFEINILPIRRQDDALDGLIGVAIDVTDRLQAEMAQRASESKFALAFRSSPDAISITTLPEGVLLDLNEGFTELTGHHRQDALGHTAQSLDLWAIPDERARILSALQANGRVRGEEMRLRRRDGGLRMCEVAAEVLDLDGQPILLSVVRDISERKHSEAALRASEEKFAKAFQASPDAVLITSVPAGRIVEVNEGFTRICGWARHEALGKTTLDLDLWGDLAERDTMLDLLRRQQRIRDLAILVKHRLGRLKHCVLSGELIELAEGRCLLSVVRDVSEREAFVRELEAKNSELERFTYTVSHDLKSPLVTIRGFLGLLEKDLAAGDHERAARDIARIHAASDTMGQLLDDLLELSRIGRMANPPEPVDLGEMAQRVKEVLAGVLDERGAELVIEPDLPRLMADRPRLWVVLQNLVENGIKFSGDQPMPRIVIGRRRDGGEEVITVSDNGIGIDPAFHDKIFGLFARLDPTVEGTGIGLALVRRIVEVHGGRVWVESEGQGKGSTFCFTLGAAQEDPQGATQPSSADSSP